LVGLKIRIQSETAPVEVDFLIVGGGIAGLMAAINAAQQSIDVIVAGRRCVDAKKLCRKNCLD
jgi:flavin-dependent dehydrogenase